MAHKRRSGIVDAILLIFAFFLPWTIFVFGSVITNTIVFIIVFIGLFFLSIMIMFYVTMFKHPVMYSRAKVVTAKPPAKAGGSIG